MPIPSHLLNVSVLSVDEEKRYQVIKLKGQLDKAGLESAREQIDSLVDQFTGQYLAFDFSELDFINSESIGYLTSVHAHLTKSGKNLVILAAKPNVKDVFMVIGLLSLMSSFDSLSDFVNTLS